MRCNSNIRNLPTYRRHGHFLCLLLIAIIFATGNAETTPVAAPTITTPYPTKSPTKSPTGSPTKSPTSSPTKSPTSSPSNSPVVTPNKNEKEYEHDLQTITERGVTITLTGVMPLDAAEINYFENRTEAYIEYYYGNDDVDDTGGRKRRSVRKLLDTADIYDVSVSINVTEIDPPFDDGSGNRRLASMLSSALALDSAVSSASVSVSTSTPPTKSENLRKTESSPTQSQSQSRLLQGNILRITYDQSMTYRYSGTIDASQQLPTNQVLIQDPFNTLSRRNSFISFLKDDTSNAVESAAFDGLTTVLPPELYQKEGISTVAIIASAAGAAAFVVIVALVIIWRRRNRGKEDEVDLDDYNPNNRRQNGGNRLVVDDQSTLIEPNQDGVFTSQQSLQGRHHPGSIATDDPDYRFNQEIGEQSIISNTDGTLGDATRQSTKFSANDSILGPNAGHSIFSDDQSFEAYLNRGGRKEQMIEIYAPAGKLGVVIDTPDNGAPVLHRIKETCPIADKLRVGDKLIAVDDEDVRSMTAVKVSKLISHKSANPTRKFTIVRYL